MGSYKDLTGQKFGRLIVIERGENYVSPSGNTCAQWWCKCECDNPELVLVTTARLKNGTTKSCGCLQKEITAEIRKKYNRYDLSGEYGIGYTNNTDSYGRNEFYFDSIFLCYSLRN